MVLDSIRSHFPAVRFGQVLPFPKFGAAPANVQHPVAVQLTSDAFSPTRLHDAAGEKTARIVLTSKDELPSLLERGLQQASEILTQWSTTPTMVYGAMPGPLDVVRQALASSAQALANAISPETGIDPNGNLFGVFKASKPSFPPAATAEEKKTARKKAATRNAAAIRAAFKKQLDKVPAGFTAVSVELPERLPDGVKKEDLIRDLAEMAVLNGYNYNQFRAGVPAKTVNQVVLNKKGLRGLQAGAAARALAEGKALGEATNLTRHLVDSPANPERTRLIADAAQAMDNGTTLRVQVRDKQWLRNQGMHMMLSVGDGNAPGFPDADPRMVEMVYTPPGWNPATGKTVLLVGKGIVFDTGGTNLKSSEYIHNMRGDMAGGAAVIGALKAINDLKLQGVRVVGLVPLTENRIGHNATLENRVVVARNGKRVAISNTDAEGRLVLGDAIHYGMDVYKPDVVADIATLTGGKVRGVGAQNAVAISGNNRDLLKAANGIEAENLGRTTEVLPLTQAHHRWVTRDAAKEGGESFADVYNSVGRDDAKYYGVLGPLAQDRDYMLQHSAQGAAFIREFLANPKTPWVHYDMAGAEYDEKDPARGNWEWATGFGVKDLYHLVNQVASGTLVPDAKKTETVKPFSDKDLK